MRNSKVDQNHADVKEIFVKFGFSVFNTSMIGKGFPDLVVGINGKTYLVEIKNGPKAKYTEKQIKFIKSWRGHYVSVVSANDAFSVCKVIIFERL